MHLAASEFLRSGLEKHFLRQEKAKLLKNAKEMKKSSQSRSKTPNKTKENDFRYKKENKGNLDRVIVDLHKELHQLKI